MLEAALSGDSGDVEDVSDFPERHLVRPSRWITTRVLAVVATSVMLTVILGHGCAGQLHEMVAGVESFAGIWPSQLWAASPHDNDGFCLAGPGPSTCTMEHNPQNAKMIKVSLFGNSYSGFYFWADYSLKHVIEGVQPSEWSVAGLTEEEIGFKVSMHTAFNSGLAHHVDNFRRIIFAEDPDYVVLQDGSLIPMGWKGGMAEDGSTFKASPQARRTAKAMQYTYGKVIWEWASKHKANNGRKCVVFLVASWARPEEAFFRADTGQDAELEGEVSGSWAYKNYEVYREGVTPELNATRYMNVHHEGEMLQATLEGLGIYRERIFKGAAAKAGRVDSPEFRQDCPFEVSIVPVGVAFHDVRTRVEDVFRAKPVPDYWWPTVNRSSYVHFRPDEVHRQVTQSERKTWFGAGETDLLFSDRTKDMPWFGHPSPAGMFMYGIMVKRTILAVMQGRDGVKDGVSMGQQVQLKFDSGMARNINNLLIEEANHFDIEAFNKEWVMRGARICDEAPWVCPGGGVHALLEATTTLTKTTKTAATAYHDPVQLAEVVPVSLGSTSQPTLGGGTASFRKSS